MAFSVSPPGTTLAWNLVTNAPVSGYRLYWGTASHSYGNVLDAGNTNAVTVPGLSNGVTYFFAATAYNTNGVESDFSSEISYTPAATNFPTVTLTSPANNSIFVEPANISLAASVNPNGHTISMVKFYDGTTLLGQDSTSPYSFTWSNVVAGNYSFRADAIYDSSNTVSSAVANVIVTSSRPPGGAVLQLTMTTNHQARIVGNGQGGAAYDVLASADLRTWILIGTVTADTSGAFSLTDSVAPSFSQRFYRARQADLGGGITTNGLNQVTNILPHIP